jgi:hypothetical protein
VRGVRFLKFANGRKSSAGFALQSCQPRRANPAGR